MARLLESAFAAATFALALGAGAWPAAASVMTFEGLPVFSDLEDPYSEDGIVATTGFGDLASNSVPETLHLDDSGTSFANSVRFELSSGRAFDAVSFDILPVGSEFGAEYDNVGVTGFLAGGGTVMSAFPMGLASNTYFFAAEFANLIALEIEALFPDGECLAAPCAHFDIDNVELVAVPLPQAVLMLLSGLIGLGLIGRRAA